jgi:hypothetical protein
MMRRFQSGKISAKELVKYIEKIDREQAAKERVRVWGKDYPTGLK